MTFRQAIGPMFHAVVNRFSVTLFVMMAVMVWLNSLCN